MFFNEEAGFTNSSYVARNFRGARNITTDVKRLQKLGRKRNNIFCPLVHFETRQTKYYSDDYHRIPKESDIFSSKILVDNWHPRWFSVK